jgi:hypothetical protein
LFYGVHSYLYYQHGEHEKRITIIQSFLSTKQGDPLRGFLFALAHYQTFFKTIAQAPNCDFSSLTFHPSWTTHTSWAL